MKTNKDNDVTNCIGLAYFETEIKLSGPIKLGVVYGEKTRHDNDMTDYISAVYIKSDIGLSWLIVSSADCDEN